MTVALRVCLAALAFSLVSVAPASSQRIIRSIIFDQRDVFDPEHDDWFFAADVANAVHTITKPFIIEDELRFAEGDDVDTVFLLETERILRQTGLFSNVRVSQEAVGRDSADIIVYTQDRWSLRPALLFGTGGGITNVGFKLEEINFLGTATQIMGYGLYRTENDIGWEGMLQVSQRRLFRSEIGFTAALRANSIRTNQLLSFYKPFRTMETPWAFSVAGTNDFGKDFAYGRDTVPVLLPFHYRNLGGWISQAYGDEDRLFISASLNVNSVQRTVPESRQAFDNTGHFLVSFASLRQDFRRTSFLNGYETEDVMEGAWGSATLGRVFSLGNGGETMWYIGGTAEQSWFPTDELYLYGTVGAGSGFGGGRAQYTYLEVNGLGHYRAGKHIVLAARFRTQTSWNWNAYRQLVLDFESGLRGYAANQLSGDNRVVANAEFRWFPGWKAWILGVSTVAFYDVGSAWDQGVSLTKTRYHHAIGLGVRFHNLKASGSDAIFRFDFAYNLDERKFTGLIFTTNQLFSAFGTHRYKAPNVYGADIDTQ